MTISELKAQRCRIEDRLKKYFAKHYDGRALLKAYNDITDLLKTQGCRVGLIQHEHTSSKYWAKESSRNREHLNKNPIIGVNDHWDFIWKCGDPGITKAAKRKKGIKNIGASINTPTKKESKSPKNKYYRINVEWDANTTPETLDFILRFFDDMGLENISSDPHRQSFRFDGTDEGLRLLKRAAMVSMDILSTSPINIGIHSEIIS